MAICLKVLQKDWPSAQKYFKPHESLKKINWTYALGEISIVIIGITIAFALNKWAENRSNHSEKQQYLQNLLIDLNSEVDQLESKYLKNIMQSLYGTYSIIIKASQNGIERSKEMKAIIEKKLKS